MQKRCFADKRKQILNSQKKAISKFLGDDLKETVILSDCKHKLKKKKQFMIQAALNLIIIKLKFKLFTETG